MTVELWIGRDFSTTHERRALDDFMEMMRAKYQSSEELFLVLASFNLLDTEVDLTVVKSDAVIAIELKECREPFEAPLNGEWRVLSNNSIIGTGKSNPYQQARNIRGKWIDFLSKNKREITDRDVNMSKVICMVCISPGIHPESIIKIPESGYFKLAGLDNLSDRVRQQNSGFSFSEVEMRQIVRLLNLQPAQDPVLSNSFIVPFHRNQNFVGRSEEIRKVHDALQSGAECKPVLISGMGGIGKTQLAVQYAYDYFGSYPEGIFWVNAANDLAYEFARLAERLELKIDEGSERMRQQRLARAFLERVNRCPNALIIFDNVDDPLLLLAPVDYYTPAKLGCHVLITSVKRIGDDPFIPITLQPLSEKASLELLLGEPPEQSTVDLLEQVRVEGEHSKPFIARDICELLGHLPLAIALSRAFLNKYRNISMGEYLERIRFEGGLTVDEFGLRSENLPTRHEAIVSATFKTQWNAVQNQDSIEILTASALCHGDVLIPVERLSLFTGLQRTSRPGFPSPFEEALQDLMDLSLVEILSSNQVRLHPLIREFVSKKIVRPEEKAVYFAENLVKAYANPSELMESIFQRGVGEALEDILIVKQILSKYDVEEFLPDIFMLSRLVSLEAHHLRQKNLYGNSRAFILQQLRNRALELSWDSFVIRADAFIIANQMACLLEKFKTGVESALLEKTLLGHSGRVSGLSFLPGKNRLVSASYDGSIRVWDILSGSAAGKPIQGSNPIDVLLVSPDGKLALTVYLGFTTRRNGVIVERSEPVIEVWDLEGETYLHPLHGDGLTGNGLISFIDQENVVLATNDSRILIYNIRSRQERKVLGSHGAEVLDIKVSLGHSYICSASSDGMIKVWNLKSLAEIGTFVGYPAENVSTLIFKNHIAAWFKNGPKDYSGVDLPIIGPEETFDMKFIGHFVIWDITNGNRIYSQEIMPALFDGFSSLEPFIQTMKGDQKRHSMIRSVPYKSLLNISPNKRWVVAHHLSQNAVLFDLKEMTYYQINLGFSPLDQVFSPDGRKMVYGGTEFDSGKQITIYDLEDDSIQEIGGYRSKVTSLAAEGGKGAYFASGSESGEIKIWSFPKSIPMDHSNEGNNEKIEFIAISSDGEKIATYDNHSIQIRDKVLWNVIQEISVDKEIKKLWYSADGQRLLVHGSILLYIYRLSNGMVLDDKIDLSSRIPSITSDIIEVSPYQYRVLEKEYKLGISEELEIEEEIFYRVWNMNDGSKVHDFGVTECWLVETKGGGILVHSESEFIGVYDIDSHQLLYKLEEPEISINDIKATRNGLYLVGSDDKGGFIVWDLLQERIKFRYCDEKREVSSFSFSEDCQIIAFITEEGLNIWNTKTAEISSFMPGDYSKCEVSPKGDYIVLIDKFNVVHCIDCVF